MIKLVSLKLKFINYYKPLIKQFDWFKCDINQFEYNYNVIIIILHNIGPGTDMGPFECTFECT